MVSQKPSSGYIEILSSLKLVALAIILVLTLPACQPLTKIIHPNPQKSKTESREELLECLDGSTILVHRDTMYNRLHQATLSVLGVHASNCVVGSSDQIDVDNLKEVLRTTTEKMQEIEACIGKSPPKDMQAALDRANLMLINKDGTLSRQEKKTQYTANKIEQRKPVIEFTGPCPMNIAIGVMPQDNPLGIQYMYTGVVSNHVTASNMNKILQTAREQLGPDQILLVDWILADGGVNQQRIQQMYQKK